MRKPSPAQWRRIVANAPSLGEASSYFFPCPVCGKKQGTADILNMSEINEEVHILEMRCQGCAHGWAVEYAYHVC